MTSLPTAMRDVDVQSTPALNSLIAVTNLSLLERPFLPSLDSGTLK